MIYRLRVSLFVPRVAEYAIGAAKGLSAVIRRLLYQERYGLQEPQRITWEMIPNIGGATLHVRF